ncbi:LOW QUALITY PROTEIN: segmentation protein cap'n'collar [Diaphorina citri]|uniref:LOW QUALITY PROTEIN: segmentation protein cap'n'collar n=1 Tax=Diaphorina citri TaxID=121845 RepID=A0A1S4E6K6_DIACI|nr:LOW QUALITY PROTEIN: segmentation protein cap'n'collar [Diaphorina citri]
MAIIETLWKEDVATGGILNGGEPSGPQVGVTLSAGGATSSNDTDPDPSSSLTEQTFEDPHSVQLDHSINTAACETHLTEFNYNSQLSPSSSRSLDNNADLDFCKDFDSDDFIPEALDDLFPIKKPFLDLDNGDIDLEVGAFKTECKQEDDPDFLLVGDEEPLNLFNYFKDEFLLNNALQPFELNDCCAQGASSTDSIQIKEEKEESKELAELDLLFEMMQTAQYHHHPGARAYHQGRVPYVRSALGIPPPSAPGEAQHHHQRWQDLMTDHQNVSYPTSYSLHHQYSPNMTSYHHGHHDTSGAIIHNATLPPPMGDLNNTSPYHIGASPNLGSAVTSSMNLTNCDSEHSIMNSAAAYKMDNDSVFYQDHLEPYHIGASPNLGSAVTSSMNLTNCDSEHSIMNSAAAYKMDNDSVFYQHNISNQSLNNQTENFFPSILNDEDLQLMDMAMNESMYGNMLDNVTSTQYESDHRSDPSLGVAPHDRCTDSDSAVSSMGSERVPSLSSDNEWMETNSDSGHTPGDHYSAEYSKYRWYDNYMYLRSHSHSMGSESPASSGSHRIPPPAVAQKKYHLYGRRLFHDHNSTAASTSSDISSVDSAAIKFEMNDTDSARLPMLDAASCSSKYNSSDDVKYSCRSDFARTSHRPSLSELVSHNHTYSSSHSTSLAPETLGATSRNYSKDKTAKYIEKLKMVDFAARKSEEEQMTRDEKKARALNIPIPVNDIINLPMDEFNERLSKYDLSETQLSLIRDIRRRGKNKVAAQNCRKRKLDQILSLADEVKQMKDKKRHLMQEHEYLSQECSRVKSQFSQLYKHVFNALRDSDGNPYSPFEFSLEQTNDGNVELVRRQPPHLASQGHPSTSSKDNSTLDNNHSHQYRSKHHKDYHDHRKE